MAEVVLAVGDSHMTAIITANAVRELQLKKGNTAAALIKSTDVMIERLQTSRLIRTKTKSSRPKATPCRGRRELLCILCCLWLPMFPVGRRRGKIV